jgi:hypothetical protein
MALQTATYIAQGDEDDRNPSPEAIFRRFEASTSRSFATVRKPFSLISAASCSLMLLETQSQSDRIRVIARAAS